MEDEMGVGRFIYKKIMKGMMEDIGLRKEDEGFIE